MTCTHIHTHNVRSEAGRRTPPCNHREDAVMTLVNFRHAILPFATSLTFPCAASKLQRANFAGPLFLIHRPRGGQGPRPRGAGGKVEGGGRRGESLVFLFSPTFQPRSGRYIACFFFFFFLHLLLTASTAFPPFFRRAMHTCVRARTRSELCAEETLRAPRHLPVVAQTHTTLQFSHAPSV